MQANSETEFLNPILVTYGYNPYAQDCAAILATLCLENQQIFLKICYELFSLIIPSLLRPAPLLPNKVLETIAGDLSKILLPLWRLQIYSDLVPYIIKAQNMASYACSENNKETRSYYIISCFESLDRAYKFLGGI